MTNETNNPAFPGAAPQGSAQQPQPAQQPQFLHGSAQQPQPAQQPQFSQGPAQQPQYAPPVYAARPPRPRVYPTERGDLVFAFAALPLTFFLVAALWSGLRAGFTLAYDLIFFALSAYLCRKRGFPGAFPSVCGLLALALSAVFICSDAGAVLFLCVPVMLCLSVAWFAGLSGRRVPEGDLGPVSYVGGPAVEALSAAPKSVRTVLSAKGKRRSAAGKALLGVICALPLLIVVTALLSRSDAAFENLLGRMVSDPGLRAAQLLLSLLLTPLLLGFAFALRKDSAETRNTQPGRGIDAVILVSGMCLLCAVYLLYLFSQLAYFFSGFLGILPEGAGLTTAEYARRGFFELCAIAAINFAALFLALLGARKTEGKVPVALRVPAVFIVLFSLLLIATAISKLLLYIRTYGLSVRRLNAAAFIVFLAAVFIALGLRFFLPRVRVLQVALPAAACVLLALGLADVNRVTAEYNYRLYRSDPKAEVDVAYFAELGGSGVEKLVLLAEDGKASVRVSAKKELWVPLSSEYYEIEEKQADKTVVFTLGEKRRSGPLAFCVPDSRAYKALETFLAANPDYVQSCAEKWGANGYYYDW